MKHVQSLQNGSDRIRSEKRFTESQNLWQNIDIEYLNIIVWCIQIQTAAT